MTVNWTKHRFSGGALVLDAANTVVHRGDPARSFDRFDDPAEIARFADAASGFRAGELGGRRLEARQPERVAARVLAIREAADSVFRTAAPQGAIPLAGLPALLRACADGLEGQDVDGEESASRPLPFETALALSALSLLSGDAAKKLRICPNCNWLFLDRSRNATRLWCDMAVCGNRHKAKRHYQRRKMAAEEVSNA